MAGINGFGWVRKPSAWKEAESWRARRANFAANSINAGDLFGSVMMKAQTDQAEGLSKLAATAAAKRIKAAAKAKFDETTSKIDDTKGKLDVAQTKVDKTA